uniref:Uncharacterized protein n=1 Tax=Chrysotila carterae TaxID=13221 RepID=A0A6S9SIX2_CHRCT
MHVNNACFSTVEVAPQVTPSPLIESRCRKMGPAQPGHKPVVCFFIRSTSTQIRASKEGGALYQELAPSFQNIPSCVVEGHHLFCPHQLQDGFKRYFTERKLTCKVRSLSW